MMRYKQFWPYLLIGFIVLLFFWPIFKGYIPFPGDLLVNQNPYKSESFLGFAPGGYPDKAQGPDVITEIYPWRNFSINTLKDFSIPFWNPHNFSGNPQMANFQTAIFYPFNLLYFILPFNMSWTILIMLQPLLAGFFMYLFLRKSISLSNIASVFGAIAFSFCSYMTVWIEYGNIGSTLLWLPLILFFTKRYFEKANAVNFLGISLSFILSILAGYIQGVFYIYVLCFLYYGFLLSGQKDGFRKHKKNLLFLISLFLPFVITSFQILPTLKLFSESTRGAYPLLQIEKNLSPIVNLITIVIPDFFGHPATRNYWIDGTYIERVLYPGIVVLFFALYSIFTKINVVERKFFILVGIVSLVIATNFPLVKYFYLIPIPVISTTVATREFSIFIFSLIVLSAIGINHFIETKSFSKKFIFFVLFGFSLIWISVLVLMKLNPDLSVNLKISFRNLIIPSGLLFLTVAATLLKRFNLKLSIILLLFLIVFDLFYFFNKITPFAPSSFTYPTTPVMSYLKDVSGINRFWGYGNAYIPPNFQSVDSSFSTEGNDPLHLIRYTELLASSKDGKLPNILPRPDANIAGGYGSDDLKQNLYRKRILDLLGVKYILHKQELVDAWYNPDLTTFPKDQYELIYKVYPWQIYKNINVLPRFFVTGEYIVAENKTNALKSIYNENINLHKTLILEKSPKISIDKKASGSATLLSYKPNKIIFEVNTSGNSLFFLSDNYYPEWEVKVDGEKKEVLLSNYSFRAVEVEKGNHQVEFYYNPKAFSLGLGIGALGIILLFFTLFYVRNNQKTL
ncbi:MAG: hypothetical protein US50_C0020G0002 [Candidatus Nomurabacteria bacterium GW2011_GWB1_37_5]|uniref:Bacterial membrane protein YfhO n=1 Tax=Candidatus Nomurabacteria bacterium GW2011_GWB1_37_5 TaxID=1618742 RepID=A0A0G0GW75_9BACT|nr:MAG: hypothetical protein US50_C0020G0002 [Candidatus Nomurabacteria bacterium GW2011_GWB1_37_5]